MLKKFLIGTFAVLMFSTAIPISTIAGEVNDTATIPTTTTAESTENNDTATYDVMIDEVSGKITLISADAVKYGITTLQLSLEVNADIADIYCEFDSENNIKVSEQRYNYDDDSHQLNIYMSGTEILFDSNGSLNIGTVKDKSGNFVTDIDVKSLNYVYNNEIISVAEANPTVPATTTTKPTTTTSTTTTTKPTTTTSTTTTTKPTTTTSTTTTTKPTTTTSTTTTTKPITTTSPITTSKPTTTTAEEVTASLKIDDSGKITLISDFAQKDGITTLQLSLNVETDTDAEISFEFNPENKNKISDYRADSNKLNIYMSDTESLFNGTDSLNVGVIKVKDKSGNDVAFRVSATEDSLKYVCINTLINVDFNIEDTTVTNPVTTSITTSAATSKPTTTTTITTSATTSEPITTTTSATTIEPTTTTTSTTTKLSTTTTTEPKTTTTATSIITTVPVTTAKHITSDEELCSWSINNYNDKNDNTAVSAKITEKSGNKCKITLTDDSDNVLDVYEIDSETGIGTDSAGNEVNLPQTGNNSLKNILTAVAAFMMTIFGFCTVKLSGINRRKKNEQ